MIPTFLSELVRTVVIMTITGSLLCLLLLAIKPLVRHRLPKAAQYYFWIVVLGTLLIPISRIVVLPSAAPNTTPIHAMVERNIISQTEHVDMYTSPQSRSAAVAPGIALLPTETTTMDIPRPSGITIASSLFMLAYPFVVLLVAIYSLIGYSRFIKKLRRGYARPHSFELDMLGELAMG